MNSFISQVYAAIGIEVSGYRYGVPFIGTITRTRVKYGTDISVTVEDAENIYIIDGTALFEGKGGGYENLHVYL
tara:strand:- start:116 stop:337 length:222 start_codon:yes stop_codon:yes gene_type:complete